MTIMRATATLKSVSGLARDNVVNSFHFEGESEADAWASIDAAVRAFYFTANGAVPAALGPISHYMSHGFTTIDVNIYNIPGTLEPDGKETPSGPPVFTSLGAANQLANVNKADAQDLPNEVAICGSYQGTPGPGVVQARRRGRIYVGPWNGAAISMPGGGGPRPSEALRDLIGQNLSRLAAAVDLQAEWVVYSRPFPGRDAIPRVDKPDLPALAPRPATTVGIDQIWVDDEFDTQRRRGLQRTGRTLIASAG